MMGQTACYYVPQELLPLVIQQIPDAIALDFSRPLEDQLYRYADRIRHSEPHAILAADLPEETARQLSQQVVSAHRRFQISLATREASWPLWLKNALENYATITQRATPIDAVIDWPFRDKPLLIIGNGQSFFEIVPALQHTRDRYAILACWHALPKLHRTHIVPDAVIHIDKLAPCFFEGTDLPDTVPLIISPISHPGLMARYPDNPVYYLLSEENEAHQQWAQFLGRPLHRPALGTVLSAGLQAGLYLGHTTLILTGAELCFYTQDDLACYNPWLDPSQVRTVQDARGETRYTMASFLSYVEFLRDLAATHAHEAHFYNASWGGIPIPGFAEWSF